MGSYKGRLRDILIQYTRVLEEQVVNPARKDLQSLKGGVAMRGSGAKIRDSGDSAAIDDLVSRMENRLASIKRIAGSK